MTRLTRYWTKSNNFICLLKASKIAHAMGMSLILNRFCCLHGRYNFLPGRNYQNNYMEGPGSATIKTQPIPSTKRKRKPESIVTVVPFKMCYTFFL